MSTTTIAESFVDPLFRKVWSATASLSNISTPLPPISDNGNNTFQMEMTDHNEPCSTDLISITLWNDAGGLLPPSNWSGTRSIEQTIAGGKLVVR